MFNRCETTCHKTEQNYFFFFENERKMGSFFSFEMLKNKIDVFATFSATLAEESFSHFQIELLFYISKPTSILIKYEKEEKQTKLCI